ncbi:MAG: hypothetical protein DMF56_10280 [Acidobacteria bacterium]|nr:MAG: hypothetical protein DMF56_10280 [Acidobacteriota bacterium]
MRVLVFALVVSLSGAAAAPAADRFTEDKIQPSAYRAAARAEAFARVNVYFKDNVSFDDARAAILAAGGALDDIFATDFGSTREITAKIAPPSLNALANDERVRMIGGSRHFQLKTHNAVSASLAHVTELQAAPYGLSGAGVVVSQFELAAGQSSHIEFGGRFNVMTTGGATGDQAHATHVAGTIAASGLNPSAKGMAPNATIYQFKAELGPNGEALYNATKTNELASRGVVADNNSWGFVIGWSAPVGGYPVWDNNSEYFGAYDYEYSAPLDQISRDKGVLFVHSSGNEADDGPGGTWNEHRHRNASTNAVITDQVFCYSKNSSGSDCPLPCTSCETTKHHAAQPFDTISVSGSAKNVLTVGAVSTNVEILGLSSRGPAKDGRIKPEVVARGASVFSSFPTNSYGSLSGTSMAAPVVTGVAALVTEQWRRTFATNPKPEELKALIIAGTNDLGNPGPDYTYGFGMVNAKDSVDLIVADHGAHNRIRSITLADKQQFEMPVVVQSTQNLRVVLQWPDPPKFLPENQVSTAPALVNDLDLKIIGPTGTTYLPYVLDKNHVDAVATRGVNTIDNTEMVEIANAAPGAYRIVVTGTNVPQGPQSATIVTTARGARPCADVQEPNDTSATAWGNIVDNAKIYGGFCTAGDVDFYKFQLTLNSTTLVDIHNTGDTPLRATLTGGGQFAIVDVPPYSTGAVPLGSKVPGTTITLKIEPNGTLGVEPDYWFQAFFGQATPPRARSVRH